MRLFSSKSRNNVDRRFVDIDKTPSRLAKLVSSALSLFKRKKKSVTPNDIYYSHTIELNKPKLIDSILIYDKAHYRIVDFLNMRVVQRGNKGVRHKFIYAAVRIL